jgi:NADPH:quinone reductase-like Zn-dependent oxidoreductase
MVHTAPVNYVDLLVVRGNYQFLPPLPFIRGKGPAGVVTALGREVTSLRAGDRVLAMVELGYAEARSPPPGAGSRSTTPAISKVAGHRIRPNMS